MVQEGVTGLSFEYRKDGTTIKRNFGDSTEKIYIPKLNERNGWVLSVHNTMSLKGIDLPFALELLNLELKRSEMYSLIKKLSFIENYIKEHIEKKHGSKA